MSASSDADRRRIGLPTAVALVVANMIGSGVFATSGFTLASLGRRDAVLAAWAVAGVLALLGALSYGALARRFPESGGEYAFLRATVHPFAGFLAGWVSLLAGFTVPIAFAALVLHEYAAPLLGLTTRPEWLGTAAIAVAALLHGVRLRHGVWVQNAVVAIKLALVVGFVLFGAFRLLGAPAPADGPTAAVGAAPLPALGAFGTSVLWISFSYAGWNATVYLAGEVRDPQRNLSRSLWLGTLVVTALYLALNAIFVFAAPVEEISGQLAVAAVAAAALGGEPLRIVVSVLVAIALFTSVSAMMMAGPRVYERMAADGLFPRFFAVRGDVPARAVTLQAALAIGVLWIADPEELLSFLGFTLGVSSAAAVAGLIRARLREGAARVPVPGFPWVPGTFVVVTLAISAALVWMEPANAGWGVLAVAAGAPLYWLQRSARRTSGS